MGSSARSDAVSDELVQQSVVDAFGLTTNVSGTAAGDGVDVGVTDEITAADVDVVEGEDVDDDIAFGSFSC